MNLIGNRHSLRARNIVLPPRFIAHKVMLQYATGTLGHSEAAEAWSATKDTTSTAVLEAFVARYKDTFYAELAPGISTT